MTDCMDGYNNYKDNNNGYIINDINNDISINDKDSDNNNDKKYNNDTNNGITPIRHRSSNR